MKRQRTKQRVTFEERLAAEALRLREQAKAMAPGIEREMLLRRARQAETASHISDWLASPGLAPPKTT
jgi:hypothetical protein